MGCDIYSFAEVKINNNWEKVDNHFSLDSYEKKYYNKEKSGNPFCWRSYSMFAFLAGVRNYDRCEPISEPRGLPEDLSDEVRQYYEDLECYAHSASYLTAKELLEFDYDKTFWNRRVTKKEGNCINGAALAEEGEGKVLTYRQNLDGWFFIHLEELKTLGEPEDVRVVFWFDN
jgi:hypothetical protein